ncbi:MAG: molybdate ABC transporter substrate-binding protein [Alphaproteobacteria bacterium]
MTHFTTARVRLASVAFGLALSVINIFSINTAFAGNDPILVFAAASLKESLEEVGKSFTAGTGTEVKFSFAASSALAKQIEAAAPADIFASADLKWMDYLEEKKLIRSETRNNLLGNTLVVVAPTISALSTLDFIPDAFAKALGDGKLATGEVNSVPVGIYAKNALRKFGLWTIIEPKLAQTDNVRAALAFVARNEAPLGIVYATDARVEKSVKVIATFPADSHDPIIYPFAVTTLSKNPDAEKFLNFLKSAPALSIFEKAGFKVISK